MIPKRNKIHYLENFVWKLNWIISKEKISFTSKKTSFCIPSLYVSINYIYILQEKTSFKVFHLLKQIFAQRCPSRYFPYKNCELQCILKWLWKLKRRWWELWSWTKWELETSPFLISLMMSIISVVIRNLTQYFEAKYTFEQCACLKLRVATRCVTIFNPLTITFFLQYLISSCSPLSPPDVLQSKKKLQDIGTETFALPYLE